MKGGLLHLCSEDDSEHREANGDGQAEIQVEQDGADERYQPHQLDEDVQSVRSAVQQARQE